MAGDGGQLEPGFGVLFFGEKGLAKTLGGVFEAAQRDLHLATPDQQVDVAGQKFGGAVITGKGGRVVTTPGQQVAETQPGLAEPGVELGGAEQLGLGLVVEGTVGKKRAGEQTPAGLEACVAAQSRVAGGQEDHLFGAAEHIAELPHGITDVRTRFKIGLFDPRT